VKRTGIFDLLELMRPSQWVKNAFVFAPLLFSQRFFELNYLLAAASAFAAFCLAASAAYAFNDMMDRERDRQHPLKRMRPVAAGRASVRAATWLAIGSLVASVAVGGALGWRFLAILGSFLLLQVAYSTVMKTVVVLDVVALAAGFVLRAAAGVVAVDAHMSPWLFVCTFLLAMFLGFGKRRHELALLGTQAGGHRAVLGRYDARLLDQAVAIVSVSTVVVYTLYTLSPEVRTKLGTDRLYLTVPFVVFGVFRYLFLIYGRREGGNPTAALLGDVPLQVGIAGWIGTVFLLLYR